MKLQSNISGRIVEINPTPTIGGAFKGFFTFEGNRLYVIADTTFEKIYLDGNPKNTFTVLDDESGLYEKFLQRISHNKEIDLKEKELRKMQRINQEETKYN